jgi:hypothetical protein
MGRTGRMMGILPAILMLAATQLCAATPDPDRPGYCLIERDAHGRIRRSAEMRREFMRETGYPHGRPGYVIDHVVPLKRGGCDVPENMQWQTIEDAKTKDRWE